MGIYFSISSLLILLVFIIDFFSKERINNSETKIYKYLLLSTFFGVGLDILTCILYVNGMNPNIFIYKFLSKCEFLYFVLWNFLFTYYIFTISHTKTENSYVAKTKLVIKILFFLTAPFILFFPIHFYSTKGVIIPKGLSVYITYLICLILIVYSIIITCIYRKNIKQKKITPLYVFVFLMNVNFLIQSLLPQLFLINYLLSIVVIIMYFTIENPDLKMIQKLNIAREQAEKANHAKTDFLSSMSHEIRTPLNAIVGFSQALSEEDIPDSARDEVNDIIMASNNLLELVNGILDISKIEANKLEIVNTEYSFKKIWDELILLTKARLGEKPLELRFFYDNSIPDVLYGDHARLKQIVLNLLTNAVKYTKNGFIEMKVHSFKQNDICRLILYVEDSGIGIKQENISKLFNKFERLDLEKNNTIEGTGLGLAITKKLVELMNGQIVVQSTYGKGSKFIISIDQKIVANPVKKVEEKSKIDISKIDFSNKKVLIVDDNKINLKVAERLLQSYKVNVTCVESGFECLEKVNNEKYDLILLDDMMPRMSGSETLIKLKEKEDFNTPVVALTANAISGMKEKYLEKGFDDYLAKPIERHELKRIVNKYLNK